MAKTWQSRKRKLVRDAIYDAAIDLFAKKGFDETTVEEVAEAAGISRRSFFRYFESKDDLLALNTVRCGELLVETVSSCPANLGPLEVLREAVLAGAKFTESQPHTRQIIEIAERSKSARQAHLSRLNDVVEELSSAYAKRMRSASVYQLRPFLLAGLTQMVLNVATASWFKEEDKGLTTVAKHGLLSITRLFCDESLPLSERDAAAPANRVLSSLRAQKRPRSVHK